MNARTSMAYHTAYAFIHNFNISCTRFSSSSNCVSLVNYVMRQRIIQITLFFHQQQKKKKKSDAYIFVRLTSQHYFLVLRRLFTVDRSIEPRHNLHHYLPTKYKLYSGSTVHAKKNTQKIHSEFVTHRKI